MTGTISRFIASLEDFYSVNKRENMPWRVDVNPYIVFVSEIMLQQTQVERVKPKFNAFVEKLPNFTSLANAPQKEVLALWQGLGYNRRALNMQKSAQIIVNQYNGVLPSTQEGLESLPGIGTATAGAIVAYAFNKPVVFVETNIRRVIIHSFFAEQNSISDKEISTILHKIVGSSELQASIFDMRNFYWAITDYGAYLKTQVGNPNVKSKHYTLQSKFNGSLRQLRGEILKYLIAHKTINTQQIKQLTNSQLQQESIESVVARLISEGFMVREGRGYRLK